MRKQIFILSGIALAITIVAFIYQLTPPIKTSGDAPFTVVASFYPIAEFARQVGGAEIDVITITPAGIEPHEYEPTSQEVAQVYATDVFFYNGNSLDPWAERIASGASEQGVVVVNMSEAVEQIENDPHFWLDPTTAAEEVRVMEQTLRVAYPTQAETFSKNSAAYQSKLNALAEAYRVGLSDCDNRQVITSHAVLAYLAQAYNFSVEAITGLSPEEEPSAGRLAEIAQMAKEQQIKYIYFETLVSPKLAETIAKEIGASTLVFNPLEGLTEEESARGENYVTIMEENLQNLRTGMLCR